MDIWHQLSDDSRRVILHAQGRAREFGATAITPEHLALGIVDAGPGSGRAILEQMGVNIEGLRTALIGASPIGDGAGDDAPLDLDARAQACLQTAHLEWRSHTAALNGRANGEPLPQPKLESVHLLLGLLSPTSRSECRTLISHGVFFGEVRQLVHRAK